MIEDCGRIIFETEEVILLNPFPRRKLVAQSLARVIASVPMAGAEVEINAERMALLKNEFSAEFAEKYGLKLTYLPFFLKAVVRSLHKFPLLNAVWKEEKHDDKTDYFIEIKKKINIGIAVGDRKGLMVPVIFNVQDKSFSDLAMALVELKKRAADNKIKIEETTGAAFTLNNYGVSIDKGFPILPEFQTAILGIGSIKPRPFCVNNQLFFKPTCWLTLIFDHRVIDGEPDANGFLTDLKNNLENFKEEWMNE